MFSPYSPASAKDFGTLSVLLFAAAGVATGVLNFVPALFALVPLCDPDEHALNPSPKRTIRPGTTGLFFRGYLLSSLLFMSILHPASKFDRQLTGRVLNGRLIRRTFWRGRSAKLSAHKSQ